MPSSDDTYTQNSESDAVSAESELGDLFRAAFRRQPAGLAIISAEGPQGPVGILSSSVASVSTNPPSVSFTISTLTPNAQAIRAASTMVVHLLDAGDLALAQVFATPGSVRFGENMQWGRLKTGEPYLHDVATRLRCHYVGHIDVGESIVIAAEVDDIHHAESHALPLVYTNRAFHVFHEFPLTVTTT
ncbi:flavin reductase [Hoyosella rhizosphaerae]|uniref:Flavin reductase n=1 Tax=Hoyosella rhizosphaerae TaxID=1755582 RepID=A0A916XGC2_9ACTN|nr:flavin reductase family protein [Hoyosella rhizosphaerae]MBN4925716.1 flavin reductase [Hoyosella rhizosphaerae]GGC68517.1 flavin reductase [Hoyosella rhizosphaerae]